MSERSADHDLDCRMRVCSAGGHFPFRCHCLCDCTHGEAHTPPEGFEQIEKATWDAANDFIDAEQLKLATPPQNMEERFKKWFYEDRQPNDPADYFSFITKEIEEAYKRGVTDGRASERIEVVATYTQYTQEKFAEFIAVIKKAEDK